MTETADTGLKFEIGHVLFMDIVGYSKLVIDEQTALTRKLGEIARGSEQFRRAEAAGSLVRLPTGDGMALVFRDSPETPAQCAVEIGAALRAHPEIKVRMGIHSGPVNETADVNDRANVTGAGINLAQRVMDCGDAGHILLSKRVADDLDNYARWRPLLHPLGEVEVKHGVRVSLVNFFGEQFGNPELPAKLKQPEQARPASSKPKSRAPLAAALIFLAACAGAGSWFYFHPSSRAPQTPAVLPLPEKSIAVLPFENLSAEKENAFFASGVQDEILSDLAKIADLKVISRTSVMQYAGVSARNLREIGRALGVANILEGSVQRSANRVRVSAQLINAETDTHLWAETIDGDLADVFGIQSQIAQRIAEQLRAKISPNEKLIISARPTSDLLAYQFYTEANASDVWADWSGAEKGMARKVALLEQATRRDPGFALAWCALAKTECDLADSFDRAHLELAQKAAETALQVRPDLGEGHRELARYYYLASDFANAYQELIVAFRTLPNDSETFRIAAETDRSRNRWNEALAGFQKARELDPRNDEVAYHLGALYRELRRYDDWEKLAAKDASDHPGPYPWYPMALAEIRLDKGDPAAAQALLAQVPMDFSPTSEIWQTRFATALYLRDYEAASKVLAATPAKFADEAFQGVPSESWADGLVARAQGDQLKVEAVFKAARQNFESSWGDQQGTYRYLSRAAALDAGLGRKQEAIEEAQHAVALMPIAKDAIQGLLVARNLALVYAWTGEPDLALEQLTILVKNPGDPSYGELRFDPTWDSLRGDPRFEALIASLKPATGK